MSSYHSFTAEETDLLFLEICDSITLAGINDKVSPEKLHEIWSDAYDHFVCLSDFCSGFWRRLSPENRIDIRNPRTSLYTTVLTAIGWQPEAEFPTQLVEKNMALLSHTYSPDETLAFNTFINAMITDQQRNPVARLAVS